MSRFDGIHLADSGPGSGDSTVLCLHGIGSSSRSFAPQLNGFPPRARVVAWDAPGYGLSADPGASLGLEDYVAAIETAIERIGAGPVHLLGVSWGGVLACAFALQHRQLVRGLILADASAGSGVDAGAAASMRERTKQLEEAGPEAFARQRAPKLVSESASPELVEEVARRWPRPISARSSTTYARRPWSCAAIATR
jgi:3-oxoadipate enol-lactonase